MWDLDLSSDEETGFIFPNTVNRELYEITTVSKLSNSSDFPTCSNVHVKATIVLTAVGVDNKVIVFKDNFKEAALIVTIDSTLECINLTEDSILLLIGESNGTLSIYDVESQQCLVKKDMANQIEGKSTFQRILSFHTPNGYLNLAVLLTDGTLFVFEKIDSELLRLAIAEKNWANVNNVLGNYKFKTTHLRDLLEDTVIKGIFHSKQRESLGCFGSGQFIIGIDLMDSVINQVRSFDNCFDVIKAVYSNDGSLVFAITAEGMFHVFAVEFGELNLINIWDEAQIEDFTVLESVNGQRKIVFVLKTGGYKLSFRNWPSFEECYEISLSNFVALADSPYDHENVYLVEGVCSRPNGSIDTLRIRMVSEALPELRLEKLTQKQRFDEAIAFAKQYDLDTREVYKAKATSLASQDCTRDVLNDLKDLLSKINDAKFTSDFCLQIRVSSAHLLDEVYSCGIEICNKSKSPYCEESLKMLLVRRKKLNTFILLYPNPVDWFYWFQFCKEEYSNILMTFFKSRETDKAFLIWDKHHSDFLGSVSEDFVVEVLCNISSTVPSSALSLWFRESFLETVLVKFPNLVGTLSNWIVERAKLYELTEKDSWPANSIELLTILPDICWKTIDKYKQVTISARSVNTPLGEFRKLHNTRTSLEELVSLHMAYHCRLSFAQYCQDDKQQVAFLILNLLVNSKQLAGGIAKFLNKFFNKHKLIGCNVFHNYVADLIRTQSVSWWHWSKAPWEESVLKVLNFIRDKDLKTKSTLLVLNQSPVPWSDEIQSFCQEQLRENPALKTHVEKITLIANLKCLLLKYNLRTFEINCLTYRKAYHLMSYILKDANSDHLKDALQLVELSGYLCRSECFLRYAMILLERNQANDLLDVLFNLDRDDIVDSGPRIVSFCKIFLQSPDLYCDEKGYWYLRSLSYAGIKIVTHLLKDDPFNESQLRITLNEFRQVRYLQDEFGIYDTRNLADTDEEKWKLFHDFIASDNDFALPTADRHDRDKDDSRQPDSFVSRITRLGDILLLPELKVKSEIVINLFHRGCVNDSFGLLKECKILVEREASAELIFDVVKRLLMEEQLFTSDNLTSLLEDINYIACQATVNCPPEMILECAHLCQWTSLLVSLSSLDHRQINRAMQSDKYHVWKLSKIYRDQGMGIDFREILPHLLYCLRIACFQPKKLNLNTIFDLFSMVRKIIFHLRSKAQELASLNTSISLQSSLICRAIFEDSVEEDKVTRNVSDVNSEMKRAFRDICSSLLLRIVSQKHCDIAMGFGILSSLSQKNAISILKDFILRYQKDHARLKSLSIIGSGYGSHIRNASTVQKIDMIYKLACWVEELTSVGVNCDGIQSLQNNKKDGEIIAEMIKCPSITLDQLTRFCIDFAIDSDEVFIRYLKTLLQSNLTIQQFGSKLPVDVYFKNLDSGLSHCDAVVKSIVNRDSLIQMLSDIFPNINPYCYPALKFVCQSIIDLHSDSDTNCGDLWQSNLVVLQFLEGYQRLNPPMEYEINQWIFNHPHHDELPAIASNFLPFHLLTDLHERSKKIIEHELTPKNLEEWLVISRVIGSDPNTLRLKTIKNYLDKWLSEQPDEGLLSWQPADKEFLQSVTAIGRQVSDSSLLSTIFVWMVKKIPLCETKVRIANLAAKSNPMKKQFISLHQRLHLELIMNRYDLSHPRYKGLSDQPKDLIVAILENESNRSIFNMPKDEIWQAVVEISSATNCDLIQICFSLFELWMPKSSLHKIDNDTFTFNINQFSLNLSPQDHEVWTTNLKRTINLLQTLSKDQVIERLKAFVDDPNSTTIQRVQALTCLLEVYDEATIQNIMGESMTMMRETLSDLIYVAELENLQLAYSLAMFRQWHKPDLIRNVLTSNTHNPLALKFAASLCKREEIWDEELWNVILSNLPYTCMVKDLVFILEDICEPIVWNFKSYVNSWEFVFRNKLDQCQSREEACQIYSELLKCNCNTKLNLVEIAKALYQFGAVPALATFLLLPSNYQIAEELLKKNPRRVSSEFNELMEILPYHKKLEYSTVGTLLKEQQLIADYDTITC